ncbi:hypothetical protein Tco_1410431 [Tanacetum coccineum]
MPYLLCWIRRIEVKPVGSSSLTKVLHTSYRDADTAYSSKSGNGLLVHQVLDTAYASRMIRRIRCQNHNSEVTCEEEAKRRNSGTKTKTFKESTKLQQYAISNKEDTTYLHQLITRMRSYQFPIRRIYCNSIRRIDSCYLSQRYALNVINGN